MDTFTVTASCKRYEDAVFTQSFKIRPCGLVKRKLKLTLKTKN